MNATKLENQIQEEKSKKNKNLHDSSNNRSKGNNNNHHKHNSSAAGETCLEKIDLPAKFELFELRRLLHVDAKEVTRLLAMFRKLDHNHDALIDLQEFAQAITGRKSRPKLNEKKSKKPDKAQAEEDGEDDDGSNEEEEEEEEEEFEPPSAHVQELFRLLDRSGRGYIDFKRFVVGMYFHHSNASEQEKLRFAFDVFDSDSSGKVPVDKIRQILLHIHDASPPHSPGIQSSSARKASSAGQADFNPFGGTRKVRPFFSDIEKYDQDRDGYLTFEEFRILIRDRPEYLSLAAMNLRESLSKVIEEEEKEEEEEVESSSKEGKAETKEELEEEQAQQEVQKEREHSHEENQVARTKKKNGDACKLVMELPSASSGDGVGDGSDSLDIIPGAISN